MPDFNDFDLTRALDQEAFSILQQGNSDLVFGGSSPEEAQVFGQQINASDAPRVGAFLGGVALANLKVQNERAQRFDRIRSLQQELRDREQLSLGRDRLDEQIRSNTVQENLAGRRLDQNQDQFNRSATQTDRRLDISEQQNLFDREFASTKFSSQQQQLKVENDIRAAQLEIAQGNANRAQLDSDSLRFLQTYLVEVGNLDASAVLNASPSRVLQTYTQLVKERNSSTNLGVPQSSPSNVVDPNDNITGGGF